MTSLRAVHCIITAYVSYCLPLSGLLGSAPVFCLACSSDPLLFALCALSLSDSSVHHHCIGFIISAAEGQSNPCAVTAPSLHHHCHCSDGAVMVQDGAVLVQ